MKKLLLVLFLVAGNIALGQRIQLNLQFIDQMTGNEIDSVQVRVNTTSGKPLVRYTLNSNDAVFFTLPDNEKVRIHTEREGYYLKDTVVDLQPLHRKIKRKKAIDISISLQYRGQYEEGIEVSGNYQPDVAFSSKYISVSDFVVIHPDTLILLTYPKRLQKSSELIYYVNGKVENRIASPAVALRLETDYRNRIYLITETDDYYIKNEAKLELIKVFRGQFEQQIKPVVDTFSYQKLFFTTYNEYYPAFDFFELDLKDTTNRVLHHIEDKEMMTEYRAEFKWVDVRTKLWAWDKESETGIDREIWVGANVFTNSIYYEPPFSELFIADSTVHVFDFYRNKLYDYQADSGTKKDSVKIDFHLNVNTRKWVKRMIQDPATKKIYALYNDAGYIDLHEIDLKTGKTKEKYTLFYRYPENIQVFNNQVYYIYRPFESIQKKYLYTENLKDKTRDLSRQNRFGK